MFHNGSGTGNPTPPMQYHQPGRHFYPQHHPQYNYLPPWLQYPPSFPSSSSSSIPGHSPSPKAITPNTIRSIHQSILQSLGEDPEDEEYVIGSQQHSGNFVPPLPGPTYSLNFRQKMINRWEEENSSNFNQGGGVSEGCWPRGEMMPSNPDPEKSSTNSSRSSGKPSKQMKKCPAQKRSQNKSTSTSSANEKISEDGDDGTNRIQRRREMNKMAAARCRKRRADKTTELQDEVKRWEGEQLAIRMEIMELQAVQAKLRSVLGNHECVNGSGVHRTGYFANQRNPIIRADPSRYHPAPAKLQNRVNMNHVREV